MKKPILTLALLATVAIGGAFAGQGSAPKTYPFAGAFNPFNNGDCFTQVPCSPIQGPPCEILDVQYFGNDFESGNCTILLSRDITE